MGVVSQALERRRPAPPAVKELAAQDAHALLAAASQIPLDGTGWKTFKLGDEKWQKDAWYHYDINGDLSFLANWVGKACSRARLYLAEVDANGRPGKEVDDPNLQVIAETMFGSPAAKAEAQRLMGIHLFVPGESYIVAESADNADDDRWYVVSTSDIRRQGEKVIEVKRPQQYGGGWYALKEGTDLLIRCWTPHPRAYDQANSGVRAGLIPLREIEQLTKFEFAEIDSRLAGAGILLVPDEMTFPTPAGVKPDATALAKQLTETMSTALANRESPASLVPIIIQVPGDLVDKIKHLTFANLLSPELADRMDRAVNRLARALETEPEILTGKADMNHWSAWQVDESTISIHVAPYLSRMCDALTAGYVRTALQILGQDPDRYVLWYDTSALTVEPDRQKDGMEMWDKGLISDAAARKAGSWAEGDEPDDEEFQRRYAQELVKLDPSKIEWPDIRKAIGRGIENWQPPEQPAEGADQPNTPAGAAKPDTAGGGAPNPDNVRGLPTAAERGQMPDRRESRQAAALRVGAHMAVQRALELAGKRLLTRQNRDRYRDVPPHELHTRIRVGDPTRVEGLLASADGPAVDLAMVADAAEVDEQQLAGILTAYCSELMVRGVRHNGDLLAATLAAGLHAECGPDECYAPEHPGRCSEDIRAFHLPGRHNQQTHGHRRGGGGTGLPFTPGQKSERRAARRQGIDPDRDASAKDRQGRRAFAEWEIHAEGLSKEAALRQAAENQRVEKELREAEKKMEGKFARARRLGEERKQIDQEWRALRTKLRNDLSERAYGDKGDIAKLGETFYGMDNAERDKVYDRIENKINKRLDEAEKRFYAEKGNPEAVTGGQDTDWDQQLRTDTGFGPDAGVPVVEATVGDYLVEEGWAFRQNGTTFLIEDVGGLGDPSREERAALAARKAESLFRMADGNLVSGWSDHVDGMAWLGGDDPSNAYWQKRFNNPNHKAAASAGGGKIYFWSRDGSDNDYHAAMPGSGFHDSDSLGHEFGHIVDKHDTYFKDGRLINERYSSGKEWQAAAEKDARLNYASPGSRQAGNVRAFQQSQVGHSIVLDRGPDSKEQPNGVTTYGRSSAAEDFAESYRLYTLGHIGSGRFTGAKDDGFVKAIYFRDLFPARAAALDKLFPKFGREQKARIKRERQGADL